VVLHLQPSPFPMNSKQGRIENEYCTCGHLCSMHMDTLSYGHGPYAFSREVNIGPRCDCAQFTWAEFVLADPSKCA